MTLRQVDKDENAELARAVSEYDRFAIQMKNYMLPFGWVMFGAYVILGGAWVAYLDGILKLG